MENKIVARATNTGKYSNLRMAVHLFSAASLFFCSLFLSHNRFLTLLKMRPDQIHLLTRLSMGPTHLLA